MMPESPLEQLLSVGTDGPAVEVKRGRKQHPAGWTPGINITRDGGEIIVPPREAQPEDWDTLLAELLPPGMNPNDFIVDGETVEVRAWDSGDGEGGTKRLYYFKARLRRRGVIADGLDLESLIEAAKKVKPPKPSDAHTDRVYFAQITDLQAGQADGDGAEGMVNRVLELSQLILADLDRLKKQGTPAGSIFLPITGDLVEGVSEYYATQQFAVTLDRRDQVTLVRRLLLWLILELIPTGLPIHVAAVPGNHGENRKNGKAFTTLGDNDDIAVVEMIAETLDIAGHHSVTFSLPAKNRLSLTVDVLGNVVGLTHGHIARGGTGVEGRILAWFKSMAATRDPLGDSHILFTGHYHHARYQQLIGDTVWIQGGALCDSSDHFAQTAGLVSNPTVMKGTITRDGVEFILPHSWQRTRPTAEVIA